MANYSMKYRMQLDAYRSISVEKILILVEGTLQHERSVRDSFFGRVSILVLVEGTLQHYL